MRPILNGVLITMCFLGAGSAWALQPPSPDAELRECDPIRKEIIRLNQKPAWLGVFYQPRKALLKRRYGKCFQDIQTEEFKYLKQAEIPGHSGPKLPELPPDPPKRRWWQRGQ
jgi:hypothetical protein